MQYDVNIISFAGGAVAAFVAAKLLLSKYPRTWALVCGHSAAFWRYVSYYFVLGSIATRVIFATSLGHRDQIAELPNFIFWPLAVGLVGVLAKVSLVGALPGAHHAHMAVRMSLLLFEPGLMEQITNDEFFAVKAIVRKAARSWSDLARVKDAIGNNIPDETERVRRLLFEEKIRKTETVHDAMIHFYRFVGPKGFHFAFDDDKETA